MITKATKKEDYIKSDGSDQSNPLRTKKWWVVDAAGQSLGRLSANIASVIRGKHQPFFSEHVDCGDYVVVINAAQIKLTGNKLKSKFYYRYSGYIGGLKQVRADEKLASKPEDMIMQAVKKMLPKNKLNRQSIRKLKVYKNDSHPHQANSPEVLEFKKMTRY